MDSLQEAIEKARQEREGKIGQTAKPGESEGRGQSPLDSGKTAPAADATTEDSTRKQTQTGAARIRYTSTRQVEPEEKILSFNRVIAGDIHDPRVEAYRQLRSQVLSHMKRHNWRTLAITSAHENAGKTLTAINLAICISQEVSQTVMLVDLDLRTPHVHSTLDIDIEKGIVDHLLHDEPLENILINPGFPRMVVLPGVPQGRHSSEILTSPEMNKFMDEITNRYQDRIIIFDLPPLLRNDDAMVFVPKADTCLLVVEDGVTRPDEIERSLHLLGQSKVMGTILNKAR
jgi:Mrp family chromosome partitioning ATPase